MIINKIKHMENAKEYTLKDLDSNFYFSNENIEFGEYISIEELILVFPEEWEKVLKYTWLNFLEHCFYLILPNAFPDVEYDHEFPDEFEPTIDMFVLMVVEKFDEEVLSEKGYYLVDRAGIGYDLGILKKLGVNWLEMFYKLDGFTG